MRKCVLCHIRTTSSLISTFVVRCFDSMICILALSSFKIPAKFCSWAGWFESYLVGSPWRHIFAWDGSIKVLNVFSYSNAFHLHLSRVKLICVFEHSVMTNFNCACPVIQRGQGSGFLSEGSFWLTACMSEQRRFWRDCADAQARLNLPCSHMR